jgi:hypothetical protein
MIWRRPAGPWNLRAYLTKAMTRLKQKPWNLERPGLILVRDNEEVIRALEQPGYPDEDEVEATKAMEQPWLA